MTRGKKVTKVMPRGHFLECLLSVSGPVGLSFCLCVSVSLALSVDRHLKDVCLYMYVCMSSFLFEVYQEQK